MKKELTAQERYALAEKLDSIRGADLDDDEIDAIGAAIAYISPEYAEALDAAEQEAADFFMGLTPDEMLAKEKAAWAAEGKTFPDFKEGK